MSAEETLGIGFLHRLWFLPKSRGYQGTSVSPPGQTSVDFSLRKPPRNLLILRRGILEGDFVRGLGLWRSLRESLKHSAPVACPWPLLSGADGPGLVLGACSRSRPLHGPPNPVTW